MSRLMPAHMRMHCPLNSAAKGVTSTCFDLAQPKRGGETGASRTWALWADPWNGQGTATGPLLYKSKFLGLAACMDIKCPEYIASARERDHPLERAGIYHLWSYHADFTLLHVHSAQHEATIFVLFTYLYIVLCPDAPREIVIQQDLLTFIVWCCYTCLSY